MSKNFYKQLKIGNKKENYVCDILNICGVNSRCNNSENVKAIDLIIDDLKMLIDVKFINTYFVNSESYVGIKPEDCLSINIRHVHNYTTEGEELGYEPWICFLVKFPALNVNELRFVPVSFLEHLIESGKGSIRDGKLNLDKNLCHDMTYFLNYCNFKKNYTPKKYNFR